MINIKYLYSGLDCGYVNNILFCKLVMRKSFYRFWYSGESVFHVINRELNIYPKAFLFPEASKQS